MTPTSALDSHGGQPHAARAAAGLSAALPAGHGVSIAAAQLLTLPALTVSADGWLSGVGVRHEPIGSPEYVNAWHLGHPNSFLNHFTDGCGDPFATLKSRGVSVHGCTEQDGSLLQYAPFTVGTAHAYDEAFYSIGWENAAAPGAGCDFQVRQLARLAQVNAAAIGFIKTRYGFAVPLQRAPGCAFSAGIKCHTDGLEAPRPWDPHGHWDAPWRATGDPIGQWVDANERAALDRSPWSAADFIAAVRHYATGTGGDEMSDFADGWNARKAATGANPTLPAGKPELFNIAWHAQDRLLALEHQPASGALPKHTHTTPAGQTLSAGS